MDIVAISPHPDDVELFMGGTLRHLVELGYEVTIVDLTRGESASRGTPEIRATEAQAAAEILGAKRVQLGFPDGGIHAHDPGQAKTLARYLRQARPTLVFAPWVEERHPDHEAAGQLARRAVFLASAGGYEPDLPRHVVTELIHYPIRVMAAASFIVDISHVLEIKNQAIAAHVSQVGAGVAGPKTLVASSLGSLAQRDAFYGAQIGAAAGEPFITASTLYLKDPVSYFTGRPGPGHFFERRP